MRMDANQLGRRNLSPDAFRLALGRRYNRTKKTKSEAGSIGGASKGQSDTCLPSTAEILAKQHSVSEATVKRAGKFADSGANGSQVERVDGWESTGCRDTRKLCFLTKNEYWCSGWL